MTTSSASSLSSSRPCHTVKNKLRYLSHMSRDFLIMVFFMNQFHPSPRDHFKYFGKFADIFTSQGAPPVSTILVANLPQVSNVSTSFASVVNTGGKFATGINDTGGKQWEQLSNCIQLKMNLKKKTFLYANSTIQRCQKRLKIFSICHRCSL
jgi:hypothetical protein